MRLVDGLKLAAGGLRERKMRTALTVLGIVIGTSMIIALEASTQGQSAAISGQLEKLGPTVLLLRTTGPNLNFTDADITNIESMDNVQTAFLTVTGSGTITRTAATDSVSIVGIPPDQVDALVKGMQVQDGALFPDGDLTSVFLGSGAATPTDTTKPLVGVGDPVQITTQVRVPGQRAEQTITRTFIVTGIAAPFGSAPFVDVDNTVFVSTQAAQQILRLQPTHYNQIVVFADSPDNVQNVQNELQAAYPSNARVLSGTQLAVTISSVFGTISTLLGSIAAISLIVAGVGIANTMFVSVIERTTEIGTLKALGFKGREVLGVFLMEASLTGVIGGVLGCLLGVGVAYGIGGIFSGFASRRAGGANAAPAVVTTSAVGGAVRPTTGGGGFGGRGGGGFGGGGFQGGGGALGGTTTTAHPVFTVSMFALVILFAILVAVVAGLIPARKAARLDPVVALKRL
ncbi:MAG: putative transport system permease protein [Thermoplasmata archaeon]|nr:putative transport system permease protein [Thermoplasmata archaeon]